MVTITCNNLTTFCVKYTNNLEEIYIGKYTYESIINYS